jgi:hypothetical protein
MIRLFLVIEMADPRHQRTMTKLLCRINRQRLGIEWSKRLRATIELDLKLAPQSWFYVYVRHALLPTFELATLPAAIIRSTAIISRGRLKIAISETTYEHATSNDR